MLLKNEHVHFYYIEDRVCCQQSQKKKQDELIFRVEIRMVVASIAILLAKNADFFNSSYSVWSVQNPRYYWVF